MTTNTHILTLNSHLGELRGLVRAIPDSALKTDILELLTSITDEVFCTQTDFAVMDAQMTELRKQIYEPVILAQVGELCRYIDLDALNKGGVYSLEDFDRMLRQACEGTAKELGTFLRKYEKIGYLDFHGESKKSIFTHLRVCYPTMRRYKYTNFAPNF